jgi:hypothetical protein
MLTGLVVPSQVARNRAVKTAATVSAASSPAGRRAGLQLPLREKRRPARGRRTLQEGGRTRAWHLIGVVAFGDAALASAAAGVSDAEASHAA